MAPRVPENNKKPGVCYAVTEDGIELPVIDVTHPCFACDPSEDEVSAVIDRTVRAMEAAAKLPMEARMAMAKGSVLAQAWIKSLGTYMSGQDTYLFRLGPENLGEGYANAIDRQMAAGSMALSFRLRLRDVARLLAWGLKPVLETTPGRPLHLVNIGGGPSADSLNALLLLQRESPELLRRPVFVHVLDVDEQGPNFGARALEALSSVDGPFHGLSVGWRHVAYNWSDTIPLQALRSDLGDECVVGISSEGALFDYGSDADVAANLSALHAGMPADTVLAGSVVRAPETMDPRLRTMMQQDEKRPVIRMMGLAHLSELARGAGWVVAESTGNPSHEIFRLAKG